MRFASNLEPVSHWSRSGPTDKRTLGRLVTSHVRPRQVSGFMSISQLRHCSSILYVTIEHHRLHTVVKQCHAMSTYMLGFSLLTVSCLHSVSTTPEKPETHPTACVTIAVRLVPLQV